MNTFGHNCAYTAFFCLLIFIAGCGSERTGDKDSLQAMEKEVLAIHDEMMPHMDHLNKLLINLTEARDSDVLDELQKNEVERAISGLRAGDSLMWEWMYGYKKPVNVSEDSMRNFFTVELDKVKHMRTVMLDAIKSAENLTQKLGYSDAQ